jgi:hypothetical protein
MAICSTASFPSSPSRSRMLSSALTQAGIGGASSGWTLPATSVGRARQAAG